MNFWDSGGTACRGCAQGAGIVVGEAAQLGSGELVAIHHARVVQAVKEQIGAGIAEGGEVLN